MLLIKSGIRKVLLSVWIIRTLYIFTHKPLQSQTMSLWSVSYEVFRRLQWHLYRRVQRCVRSAYLWLSWLAPPSCPAVYLICKGELWSSSTVSAKVLYSSHNPKWQQQHQDELQERGGSLSVIYNALNSSTLLIVCITKNQTRGKTNKKCHFLFRFNAIESTSLSLRSRLFTSGSVWSRNRDYGGGWKPLQTAFINTIKEWRHEKRVEGGGKREQRGKR